MADDTVHKLRVIEKDSLVVAQRIEPNITPPEVTQFRPTMVDASTEIELPAKRPHQTSEHEVDFDFNADPIKRKFSESKKPKQKPIISKSKFQHMSAMEKQRQKEVCNSPMITKRVQDPMLYISPSEKPKTAESKPISAFTIETASPPPPVKEPEITKIEPSQLFKPASDDQKLSNIYIPAPIHGNLIAQKESSLTQGAMPTAGLFPKIDSTNSLNATPKAAEGFPAAPPAPSNLFRETKSPSVLPTETKSLFESSEPAKNETTPNLFSASSNEEAMKPPSNLFPAQTSSETKNPLFNPPSAP